VLQNVYNNNNNKTNNQRAWS